MTVKLKNYLRNFEQHRSRSALYFEDLTIRYGDLFEKILNKLEFLKQQGINESAIVLLNCDYTPDTIALLFALYQNNNIIALNTVTNPKECEQRAEISNAEIIIDAHSGFTVEHKPATSKPENNLIKDLSAKNCAGLILFSSGTTGKPKAMLHNFDNLIGSYKSKRPKRTNVLLFLLFDHIGGINTLLNFLSMGAVITIPKERAPDHICNLIERYKVILLPASPTFLNLLMISGAVSRYDLSSLRMITYGTETMPEGLLVRLRHQFPRVKFLQTFGTSETGIISTTSKSSDSLFMKFEDTDVDYKIVNGELWLRSKRQILGYLNHPMTSFTDDGWFQTGDLVEEMENGFLRINGRSKEIINVGGEKVFPAEIESLLMHLPFVQDCKVYGQQNALTGQTVAANIMLAPDSGTRKQLNLEIKNFMKKNLNAYKVPTKINFVDHIEYSSRFKKIMLNNETTLTEE